MLRVLIFLLLIIKSCFLFSQGAGTINTSGFERYKQLNEKELRLPEFKDSDEALKLKLLQLDVINKSRKEFKAPPVSLDILASRVANKMCREAAENNYLSHWNLAGEKPYHRYALAGGYDHVTENAFGEWTSGRYNISNSFIGEMMKTGHESFMAERAPNDGHKRNIIDKAHNFVGIGYFITKDEFRYYEEFIDRYLEFENIPAELKINEPGSITVNTKGEGYLYYLIIYREKFPGRLRVSQLSRKGSYDDYSNEDYLKIPAWDLARYRNGSTYRIPLKFSKVGFYYIHIFIDKEENTGSLSLSTKGKANVSGIVIKVTR